MNSQHRLNGLRAFGFGVLIVASAAGRAWAADAAPSFKLELDPVVIEGLNNSTTGDDAKFEEYRDLGTGFRIPWLHLAGQSRDGNRTLDFTVVNGGRNDARYTLEYGMAGSWSMLLDYNKIQHRFADNGHTLYTRTGPGLYEISDPVQRYVEAGITQQGAAATGAILAPLFATANNVDLGLERDRTKLRLDLGKSSNISWFLNYDHETRTGLRAGGASFGFALANEIAEPIDYRTDDASVGGEWHGRNAGLAFGYRYSKFKNNISTLIWDNPLRAPTSTQARGFEDLPADNDAGTAYLNGRTKLGGNWWASASATYSQMKQNDPLLPYTINPGVIGTNPDGSKFDAANPANLPQRRAGQSADVLNLAGNLGTHFGDNVRLNFRYRYYDYDNTSDRIEFAGEVAFHAATFTANPRITAPYAYKNDDLGVELAWDVLSNSTLSLSFDRKGVNRKFREVENSDENLYKLAFDSHVLDTLTLRAIYEYSDRSISGYRTTAEFDTFAEAEAPGNLPLLRQFYQAAKKTDAVDLQADWQVAKAVSLQLGVKSGKDDYNESSYGLLYDKFTTVNGEVDLNVTDDNMLYLWASHEDRKTSQRSRQSGATISVSTIDDWTFKANEKNDSAGLGWTAKLTKKWTLDLSGEWSKADGTGDFTATPGGAPLSGTPVRTVALDLGNYDNSTLVSMRLKLDYAINTRLGIGVWYMYEDYTQDTFRLQGITGNFLPGTTIALAPNVGDFTGNVVGLNLKLTM